MTTIAWKNGVLASDSRVTVESEAGGSRSFNCDKLFRKRVMFNGREQEVLLATAGEAAAGELFVEWFGSTKEASEMRDSFVLGQADFTILIVTEDGLFEADKWCKLSPVKEDVYAIGSGSKVALGAMAAGASAARAVEIACKYDPYSAAPIHTMRLSRAHPKTRPAPKRTKTKLPEVRKADDVGSAGGERKETVGV